MANNGFNNLKKQVADGTEIAKKFKSDAAFRNECLNNPKKVIAEMGIEGFPTNVEVNVHINDDTTYYFVIPGNPNIELSEETLVNLNAAKTTGSAGSAATAGTLGSFLASISSASTLGTASTHGCR